MHKKGSIWLTGLAGMLAAAMLAVSPLHAEPGHGGPGPKHGAGHPGKKPGKAHPPAARKAPKHGPHVAGHPPAVHDKAFHGDARHWAVQYRYTGFTPLPPGIRAQMERGKPLPPGIAKRRVPAPMLRHLPHYSGYEWYRTGDDLILVSISNGLVMDIMVNIFH